MKTILVLEDESAVMEMMRQTLKETYTSLEAASAEESLALFSVRDRVDLLLAEVMLRKGSGIQVALLLRNYMTELPIILTSGYRIVGWEENDAADLGRLGRKAVAILQEPFAAYPLSDAVHHFLGVSQSQQARLT
jgi:CheY-like chemotaxis protein